MKLDICEGEISHKKIKKSFDSIVKKFEKLYYEINYRGFR